MDTNSTPITLRNRRHLIQLLNALDYDALAGIATELWFIDERGIYHTVHAQVTKSRRVNVKLNGARSSRESILRVAGY